MLEEELKKLNPHQLNQIIEVWDIKQKPSDKNSKIKTLLKHLVQEYYIKGILEKTYNSPSKHFFSYFKQ